MSENVNRALFAQRVRERRLEFHLTQSELARRVGVAVVAVNSWEMWHAIPRWGNRKKLAEALGVSEEWLFVNDFAGRGGAMSSDDSVRHAWNTIPVQVTVDIDRGIAPLVQVLNRIPGVRTYASCEGHPSSPTNRRAYVTLSYRGTSEEVNKWFQSLSSFLQGESPRDWQLEINNGSADLFVAPEQVERLARVLSDWAGLAASAEVVPDA